MASQVEICNLALGFLGASPIVNLSDNNTKADALRTSYASVRDAELRKHNWRFAIKRDALPALVAVPISGPYSQQFQKPVDCLKILMVGDSYPGSDLSDYRTGPSTDDYSPEGDKILSNLPAPLAIKYIYQVIDTGLYDASFVVAFAAMLAWKTCERITQSTDKRKFAQNEYDEAINAAIRSNAIEGVPEYPADGSWVTARMM